MAARQIYVDQMYTLGYGLPLWDPEPSPKEVEVGDLGWISTSGGFEVLFNVIKSADEQDRGRAVPEGFEPLLLDTNYIRDRQNDISSGFKIAGAVKATRVSAGISCDPLGGIVRAGGDLDITFSGEQGSILMLKHPASRFDALQMGRIQNYIKKNYRIWYDFANNPGSLGLGLSPYDLILVTGAHKTAAWALSAFSRKQRSVEFSFTGGAVCFAEGHFGLSGDWNEMPVQDSRAGPISSSASRTRYDEQMKHILESGDQPRNYLPAADQCVFIRGYKIGRRWPGRIPKKIKASAEPKDPSDRTSKRSAPEPITSTSGSTSYQDTFDLEQNLLRAVPIKTPNKPRHPLDLVIDAIHKKQPSIDVVIIHDDDLDGVLPSAWNTDFNSPKLLKETTNMSYEVSDDECAFFAPKNDPERSSSSIPPSPIPAHTALSDECGSTNPTHSVSDAPQNDSGLSSFYIPALSPSSLPLPSAPSVSSALTAAYVMGNQKSAPISAGEHRALSSGTRVWYINTSNGKVAYGTVANSQRLRDGTIVLQIREDSGGNVTIPSNAVTATATK